MNSIREWCVDLQRHYGKAEKESETLEKKLCFGAPEWAAHTKSKIFSLFGKMRHVTFFENLAVLLPEFLSS